MINIDMRGQFAVMQMQYGKANVLDMESCKAIINTLGTLAAGPARAVVLTGSGSIFSAGVDLLRLQSGGPAYIQEFVPLISRLVHALFEFPKPLISAINGHAVAGGCVMGCATDYRIMARGTGRIGVAELPVGVPFPAAALEVVRFVVPAQHLKTVVYEGATYLPDAALSLGLVDELADADDLLDTALRKADRLASAPANIFALTKLQLHTPVLERIAAGAVRDAEVQKLWEQPDTLANVRRYVERTFKPSGDAVRA